MTGSVRSVIRLKNGCFCVTHLYFPDACIQYSCAKAMAAVVLCCCGIVWSARRRTCSAIHLLRFVRRPAGSSYQGLMGSEGRYNPAMVSNYVPHPYLVYALNPNTRYYEDFYGKKPQHLVNSLMPVHPAGPLPKVSSIYNFACWN